MKIENKLYYLPINTLINKLTFNKLLSFISIENKEQIKRYHFDIDKKLKLYSDVMVRIIVCQMFGLNNSEIVFEKEEHGKPYIKGVNNFHYNISHTRNAIVIAVSEFSVGVDIEKIKKTDLKIANRFFTINEREYINQNDQEKDKLFYEIWTKKEAYIKYIGKGLAMSLNSFDVLDSKISNHIYTFEKDDYIISTCSEYQYQKHKIIELIENQVEKVAYSWLAKENPSQLLCPTNNGFIRKLGETKKAD